MVEHVRGGARSLRLCVLLLALCATSSASAAGSAANGQSLFDTWCSGCHGAAKNNLNNILDGANNSNVILSAWANYSPMQFLQTAFPNEGQAASDIAAYLGSVASTTPLLQVPVSLSLGSATVGTQSPPTVVTLPSAGGSAVSVTSVTSSDPTEFPIVSSTCNGTIATGSSCQIGIGFLPSVSGERTGAIIVVSNGAGNPQHTNVVGTGTIGAATPPNYEGLWWRAPAGSESGWGINFAHQGDVIFATWFTYDLTGKAWWLSMTANKTDSSTYSGTLLQTTGPAFDAVPFDSSQVVATPVGTGMLTFTDANNGNFAYVVNGVAQIKTITREVFGALPTCVFGAQNNLAAATNYQDLWWNAPAASESGWGINLTQQGDTIFATWFTYDHDHTPLWLSATANKAGPGTYTGALVRTTGPAFNAVPFDPALVVVTNVGSATFKFTDGNTGTFAYTVNGTSQTKAITREVFRVPGTVCQ